ncbi:AbrB/MazE/SpoVT family DNA-binding domain-containing protein [Plantibacter elymi (nom. nud.)]|uniref:AbrB/MazE/SpoVT family DNA-binding domain-containing protein n=1 Tax=Plantibacter elymi (nom. nud.) TaxID=199708 RepID=UPI001056193E|nr:AbrB/MazE/SpoVT family DNA-binding domain-containing protein [Plantibacter sp. VKM Ac-1784]
MSDEVLRDARGRAEEARRQALERTRRSTLSALGTTFRPADVRTLGSAQQLTVPPEIRRRWSSSGSDELMMLVGIRLDGDGFLLLPRHRAAAWLRVPGNKNGTFPVSLQRGGNFHLPRPVREAWSSSDIARIDLGYCYLLVPRASIAVVLGEFWGAGES